MEAVRKLTTIRPMAPINLDMILCPTVNMKTKLQLISRIHDNLDQFAQNQAYFDNMIIIILKLLSITEPVFTPDNDVFKVRKFILQIIYKVCSSTEKIKNHVQNTMGACLKVIETDNEQCVMYCVLIFKELLTSFKPTFDGSLKTEVLQFLKLIFGMFNNSTTQEKIFNFQKTTDLKVLISTIRLTTTISKNNVNYMFIPMGKVSFKILKELAPILKMYYGMYHGFQSFMKEIIESFPILINFFCLDIPLKSDYRDMVLDLKYAQIRLMGFFALLIKDYRDEIHQHCSPIAGKVISLMNCNMSADISGLRTELLAGFESIILIDYKYEFLPYMDKFLDETLITGKSWSLKHELRTRAYIYMDHLITYLHNKLSLNFLVRVIHLHFSNILDPTLHPDVQINLINMIMITLTHVVQRHNQLITNINMIEKYKDPLLELLFRVIQIFAIKLKQFKKFYLPNLKKCSISPENMKDSISSVLAENEKQKNFVFGYHPSQIPLYTITDGARFVIMLIPAFKQIFQFIVKINGRSFLIDYYNEKSVKNFIKHSLLPLKLLSCPIKKKIMVNEILCAISCIDPIHLKTLILGDATIKLVYTSKLEDVVFDVALNDEALYPTFTYIIFEYILNNLIFEVERQCILDLAKQIKLYFKHNKNEKVNYEYLFKIIKMLMKIVQSTKYPILYLEILKTILIIVESTEFEFDENMNSVILCLFNDLFSYHQSLPEISNITKIALAELCLAECVLKVVYKHQTMNLLSLIAYSLYIPELTPQGFAVLEKCLNILPDIFVNDSIVHVRNDINEGLCHCLRSTIQSISQPAMNLLGKFGGINRSAMIKPYQLNVQKQLNNVSNKPKIFVSFENNNNHLMEIDMGPGVDVAVETLISKSDCFLRVHSWNVIKGFLTFSMDYDKNNFNFLSNINWKEFKNNFLNLKLQYTKTARDKTFIKAITGLMICCNDEHLKTNAKKYFIVFTKQFMQFSICYFSFIHRECILEVHPYIIIDAISSILSNENQIISEFGETAIEVVINELYYVLGYNMVYFPLITHMLKQFSEFCYDPNWILKRCGCSGLHILFSKILNEHSDAKEYSSWFIQHFITAFRAMLFIFSDMRGNLTFGTLDMARRNLDSMIYWFYLIKPKNSSQHLIQKTILKELIKNITNPNDILREQSMNLICLMADKQNLSVLQILMPFCKNIISAIPGKRLFNTYTFKSQMGIMKGHIFCSYHSIPAEKLDLSKITHKYYFDMLCTICSDNKTQINKISMIKCLSSYELIEFRQTAMKVLAYCLRFLVLHEQVNVFGILLNELNNSNTKIQEAAYQSLKLCCSKMLLQLNMVDKLIFYYIDLFENHDQVTLDNISFIFYLSKLFPSCPNSKLCTVLLNAFKYLWSYLKHCENRTSSHQLKIVENILGVICFVTNSQFSHIQEICEIILNDSIIDIQLCHRIHPLLINCLLKYPEQSVVIFCQERHIKNIIWCSFFNSMLRNEICKPLRDRLMFNSSRLETLLMVSKKDPTRTIQYETIKIVYNLMQMEKKWNIPQKLINILTDIWSYPQYKDRYKNLAAIKSTEWDEPKMLIKIVLAYYDKNVDDIHTLFLILPMFSNHYPIDINFFRLYLENSVIKSCTVKWTRMVFFKFVDLYHNKAVSCDMLGRILQFILLPCFILCIKNGQKEELLCTFIKSDENIISVVLNKVINNIRGVLTGCDHDGTKVFLCQLICLLIDDLLNFNENICDLIYNSVISCTWIRCTMDLNVKFHCYLILTLIMLSNNAAKREKLNNGIYYELLKASFVEALPVINYSLDLIVSAIYDKSSTDIHTFAVCMKKIMLSDHQNFAILSHICSFLMKYHSLFYPCKQYLLRSLIGSLFPIAKNNNVPEYKKIATDLSCMIIKWELTENDGNMKLHFPSKRKADDVQSTVSQKKKSSEAIDSCLNFLAMVGCQTFDDKPESRISKLATRSAALFKTILSTEPIDTMEVKVKFGWVEKLLDTFVKKETFVKQNPNAVGNTNASVLNVVATFDLISFMLSVLSPKFMLEFITPLQDLLIQFLQLSLTEEHSYPLPNQSSGQNRLAAPQIKQYNKATIKVISDILKTFSTHDGLEKLHTHIKMIISDCLSSNSPLKIDVSLSLLKVSLINFPNYMNKDLLNTIGDILFKFNENNKNPLIKVKCLEILKTHVDTLKRPGKQIFIERIVIEYLNRARDVEYNIPFEVQSKCFELVVTYIKDLPEATEGVLINLTILEYIKTTTDERIMMTIINLIRKWIEICRDESVLFNCQVLKILKCITILNRFPKLTNTCYELNLEIFKNWNFYECIEYGLNCKSPSIRKNFFDLFDNFWNDDGLCTRLYAIMSEELNFDLEYSLAFYVQLLFVKISKNINLQGNFRLLNDKKLCNSKETISISKESLEYFPVPSVFMFDLCSSLVQLSFVDFNLAKHLWLSVFPGIWNLFNDEQRKILSPKAVQFLATSKLKNSFLTAFYEAIILCEPKIVFEPYQMVYIGKTYNLWHLVINEMEDIYEDHQHSKKNEAVEGLIQMYSLLREEDILEGFFQEIITCEDIKKALSLEQQGCIEIASQKYYKLFISENKFNKMNQACFKRDCDFINIRLTKCLRELNNWNVLTENELHKANVMLDIEHTWKGSIEKLDFSDFRKKLEEEHNRWPTSLIWKYHSYLGMLGLNELDQKVMSTVQEHIELGIKDIINKWKVLPKHLCEAHTPLLQATQLLVEIQEANDIQKSFLNSPQNNNSTELLIGIWNNRKPWIGDNLSVWNDLISWRQTFYSFLYQRHINSSMHKYIETAQDQSKLIFGEVALKQNMPDLCMKTLEKLDHNNVSMSNFLYIKYLEGKYVQTLKKYNKDFDVTTKFPLINYTTEDMKPMLLAIEGSFYFYCGNIIDAFKHLAWAFIDKNNDESDNFDWPDVIEKKFNSILEIIKEKNGINKTPSDEYVAILNRNDILANAWIQWGILIQSFVFQMKTIDILSLILAMKCYIIASKLINKKKCDSVVARILWLLVYDNHNNTLLSTLEKCNIVFSEIWLPQVLNICIESKTSIKRIVSEIGNLYPQQMYLILNRMYLTEKLNKTIKMDTVSVNDNRNDIEKVNMKINKIKQFMTILKKRNLGFIQLNFFVDQIIVLGESWDEELRQNLYDCLCQCNDYAHENKNLNIQVPSKILKFIDTIIIRLITKDANKVKFKKKKPFLVPNNLSPYYKYIKQKFPLDFTFSSFPAIICIIRQLKNWIMYLENKLIYPSKFVHQLRCCTIHNFDWSGIRIPCDHYIEDFSKAVKIHNFGGHVYLKDESGSIVKQLTIRGTDGLLYTYNISRGKCIESEERIYQLFNIVNDYLLGFKETAKRFLKISVPRAFTISPQIRMVETNKSIVSLLEVYKEYTKTVWIDEDIEFWFSSFASCLTMGRAQPNQLSFNMVQKYKVSVELMKNWVLMRYPSPSDIWTFRKTFIEHYSVLCFLEYAFNLIKLKPEMLYIDENSGVAAVLNYTFFFNEVDGKLAQNRNTPFRMTPNLSTFITPYRKYQMINCLTATGQCLNHNVDDINAKLKLLLKDEFNACFNIKNNQELMDDNQKIINAKNNQELMDDNQKIINAVEYNLNHILKHFNDFKHFSTHNQIPGLLSKAMFKDVICYESPTWRPWL